MKKIILWICLALNAVFIGLNLYWIVVLDSAWNIVGLILNTTALVLCSWAIAEQD